MRVIKGGISREIEEINLQSYRSKGYNVADEPVPEEVLAEPDEPEEKPAKGTKKDV